MIEVTHDQPDLVNGLNALFENCASLLSPRNAQQIGGHWGIQPGGP